MVSLRLIEDELLYWLTIISSELVPDPPQLPRSDVRHEWDLFCPSVYFTVGDFIESLNAEYYAKATRCECVYFSLTLLNKL